jgi:hypothetical protein
MKGMIHGKATFEVNQMAENTFFNQIESNPYFQSLPVFIQETIKQGGADIKSEEELRRCAEQLMRK